MGISSKTVAFQSRDWPASVPQITYRMPHEPIWLVSAPGSTSISTGAIGPISCLAKNSMMLCSPISMPNVRLFRDGNALLPIVDELLFKTPNEERFIHHGSP